MMNYEKNFDYEYFKPENLRDLLEERYQKSGEKIAFMYLEKSKEMTITYKKFYEDVRALGNILLKKGYSRTHIALVGENSYDWIVAYFAIVNTNNIVIPVDKELSPEGIQNIFQKSDTTVVIYSETYQEEIVSNQNLERFGFKELKEQMKREQESIEDNPLYNQVKLDNEAMMTIVYTSGSTSQPKGAMLSHKNITSNAYNSVKHMPPLKSSMLVLPLNHTYALTIGVVLPIIAESKNFINSSMRYLVRDLQVAKPEYMSVVPMMVQLVHKKIWEGAAAKGNDKKLKFLITFSNFLLNTFHIDMRKRFFSNVTSVFGGEFRDMFISGAPFERTCVKDLQSFGIHCHILYGTTECSPAVTCPMDGRYNLDASGIPMKEVEIRFINDEIQVRGDNVFLGYYKDEARTRESFEDGWFKTRDLGEIKDGFLNIRGRIDNLIILTNGENVSPEELEAVLQGNIPEITEVITYGENDEIIAEIFLEQDSPDERKKIENRIFEVNKQLPVYKHIARVIFRDSEFEKTTTKKIIRK